MSSMSSAPRPFQADGADRLLKRDATRLWYRLPSESDATPGTSSLSAIKITKAPTQPLQGTDRLIREEVKPSTALVELKELFKQTDSLVEEKAVEQNQPTSALTSWRETPSSCPVLLLSAAPILDARNPGPILGPGTQYRIIDVADGIVCLQVATVDGQIAMGYCTATDFICIDSAIGNYRRNRQTGPLGAARVSINKVSSRLSGVTSSLIG